MPSVSCVPKASKITTLYCHAFTKIENKNIWNQENLLEFFSLVYDVNSVTVYFGIEDEIQFHSNSVRRPNKYTKSNSSIAKLYYAFNEI